MIPILNETKDEITTRDNLGILGATNSQQNILSPVITLVTPRAFYWPFMVWNYYEYNKHVAPENSSKSGFNKWFVKRNDYFFVLGNILAKTPDQRGIAGTDRASADAHSGRSAFDYNTSYLQARFGGMQYYNGGCDTLGLISDVDNDGNSYTVPHVTRKGEPLAIAFADAVKDTEYYRNYRINGDGIPASVLIEWGKKVNLSMDHLYECKKLIKEAIFEPTRNAKYKNDSLISSSELVRYMFNEFGEPSERQTRTIIYQEYFERNISNMLPDSLKDIAVSWEVIVARKYLTYSIETIWKSLLLCLSDPVPMEQWIDNTFNHSSFNMIEINGFVKDNKYKWNLTSNDIEDLFSSGRSSSNGMSSLIENAMIVMFSLYNRYKSREDIDLSCGKDISIEKMIEHIDAHNEDTVKRLICFFMQEWILKRHLLVAQNKMYQGRDAYYFYEDADICFLKTNDYEPGISDVRFTNIMSVMKDLDMLYE